MEKTVLIVSADYPPEPGIGSLNVSKITKYLLSYGWRPIILTAPLPSDVNSFLPLEVPQELVHYVPWPPVPSKKQDFDFLINRCLYLLLGNVGWYFPAVKKGLQLIRESKPCLIFASSPHHIAQLIGYKLARASGLPFIAHLRDPWTIDPNFSKVRLTNILGKLWEKKICSFASAIVVVSEGYAGFYAKLSMRPVYVIHNGFDPEDFPQRTEPYKLFTLFFAGSIYRGKRSITPLLEALIEIKEEGYLENFPLKLKFRLSFDDMEAMRPLLKKYREVVPFIDILPWTSRIHVLEEECKATYLLLPLGFSDNELYFYSGKLFEYMGARRPILCLASRKHLASELICKLEIGVVCENKEEVVDFLREALHRFYKNGRTMEVNWEKVRSFSWDNQVRKMIDIMEKLIRKEKYSLE